MKQKWFAALMTLCIMMFVASPLTVSAESSNVQNKEAFDDLGDLDDTWGSINEHGFANNMMIVMSLYDGLEDDPEMADRLNKTQVLSGHLEPGHIYRASLDFMIVVDRDNIEKYDDIKLQVRFPETLIRESPNAIGFSVNGSQIDTWYDTFGIDCEEDIDLYYLSDTGTLMTMASDEEHVFTDGAMDCLFASESGMLMAMPFQEALEDTIQMEKYEVAYMRLEFALYAAPQQGKISASGVALNYWEGQRLMYSLKTTPAPASSYRTATLDAHGKVILPPAETAHENRIPWGFIWCTVIAVVGLIIFLWYKVCKSAHERGITGFMNIFLDFMKLSDEYDE